MIIENNTTTNKYFLAHNEIDIFIYNTLLPGCNVESGQPFLEKFNTLNQLQNRLIELGQVWVDPNQEIELTPDAC